MLNPKWFDKKLYYIEHFNGEDLCDYYDECEDCWTDPKECSIILDEKKKHRLVNYIEFELEKFDKYPHEYILIDSCRVISIQIGKREPCFKEHWDIVSYIPITCKDLKYKTNSIRYYKQFYFGKNGYSRNYVYFALKLIKDPEILVPKDGTAPLVIRNEKITINIAPRVEWEEDE